MDASVVLDASMGVDATGMDRTVPSDASHVDAGDAGPMPGDAGHESGHDGGLDGAVDALAKDASQCAQPIDCPAPANACTLATCTAGVCGTAFVAAGTATPTQTVGDCMTNTCDGAGSIVAIVDDTDLPSDSSMCTTPVCTNGVPSTPPKPSGTTCGAQLLCDGSGNCVGCLTATDCPGTNTDCQTTTCTAGMCGFSFTAAGTPTSLQTPGDCQTNECDGVGNIMSVIDNTDLPANSNQCTLPTCAAGVPSTPPSPQGTACTQNGGTECDGNGNCISCTTPSDCPGATTDCQQPTCNAGACGVNDTAAGTPTSTQTPGDCHTNECDGAGNIVSVVDDTDLPSSSNPCAPGVCTAGTPSTANATQGTACTQNGGAACDGQGACTQSVTVVRVGTGASALTSAATATFLETYFPLAGATPISTVALPTTATAPSQPLLLGGTSVTEGGLSRSGDGHYLQLAGYAATVGEVTTTTGLTRVVGRVDATGNVDTTTRLSAIAFAGASIRGATSVDGTNFWASGTSASSTAGGVWYVPLGSAGGGTQIVTTPNNMRGVDVFAGALYGASGTGAFTGVLSFGGLPTTAGATATILPGMSTTNPGGFVLLDLNPAVAGVDTLFVADSSAGIERWTSDGTTWTKDTTFTVLTAGCLGVAGWATSTGATLVAAVTSGTLQRIDVPTTGSPTATLLVTAATNTAYRGISLAPH